VILGAEFEMPIYEYKCENGHVFEELQKMSDDPLTTCVQCGAPVQRVFHPIAVHFKGSGFYTTDYGSKKAGASSSDNNSSDSGSSDSSSKNDSGSSEKKNDKKSDSTATSSSSSGSGSDS
jgi:putative FmdB family regulatory protein